MTHKELSALVGTTQNGVEIVERIRNDKGKYVYRVRYNGQEFIKYRTTVANMIAGTARESTVTPKSQRAEATASNNGRIVTYKYNTKGLSWRDVQQLAYNKIDNLREQARRIEREIDLLLTLSSDDSFWQEQEVLKAQAEEQAAAKKAAQEAKQAEAQRKANRIAILQRYIDTYDSKIVSTMLQDMQKGQVMLLQKQERINKAQTLIAELSK